MKSISFKFLFFVTLVGCTDSRDNQVQSPSQASLNPNCPAGTFLNAAKNACVVGCPSGQILDLNTNSCVVSAQNCQEGYVWKNNRCEAPTPKCPVGYVLDERTNRCFIGSDPALSWSSQNPMPSTSQPDFDPSMNAFGTDPLNWESLANSEIQFRHINVTGLGSRLVIRIDKNRINALANGFSGAPIMVQEVNANSFNNWSCEYKNMLPIPTGIYSDELFANTPQNFNNGTGYTMGNIAYLGCNPIP